MWKAWLHVLEYASAYQTLIFAAGWGIYFWHAFLRKRRNDLYDHKVDELKKVSLSAEERVKIINMVEWFEQRQNRKKHAN